MDQTTTQAKRTRISVDVPDELRWHLKQIAHEKRMKFKDYLQGVFDREAQDHALRQQTASSPN